MKKGGKIWLCKVAVIAFVGCLLLINTNILRGESDDVPSEFIRKFQELKQKLVLENEIPEGEIHAAKGVGEGGVDIWRLSHLREGKLELGVRINIKTKEVMHISNVREQRRREKWAEEALVEVEPLNTQETMEKLGREFVEKIRGYFPSNLSSPSVGFRSTGYPKGSWDMIWFREEKGYRHPNDWIQVTINDRTRKLISYEARLVSEELVSTDVKITEDEAKEIAAKHLRYFAKKLDAPSEEHDRIPNEASSVKLEIVNPNYVFVEDREVLSMRAATETVLAYIVELNFGVVPSFDEREQIIWVWVDAETGEVVGGGSARR